MTLHLTATAFALVGLAAIRWPAPAAVIRTLDSLGSTARQL